MKTTVARVAEALDRELKVSGYADKSHNGLQVANSGRVRRVACGVDACMEFFEAAVARGADFLVCHHGLSWGDSLARITDSNYRRLAFLIRHDLALYGCHLPLDAHPRLGNNAQLCRALGLGRLRPFGWYQGQTIGFAGTLPAPVPYCRFRERVMAVAGGGRMDSMDFGPDRVRRVAVVSGGGADELGEAARGGLDVFVSGEPKLSAYHEAREYGIHAIFAGHYATEVFGVRAVAGWIGRRLGLPADFIDLGTPF